MQVPVPAQRQSEYRVQPPVTSLTLPSALSAYMFFVQDYRERLKSENPDATFGEVGKLLGAKWKEMSAGEKKVSRAQRHGGVGDW